MARGDARPDLLCAAALELFATEGVAGTSLQMIADRLGVTKAAVYHHHRSKASIIRAVMDPAISDYRALVQVAEGIEDPTERQTFVIRELAEQAVSHRTLYMVMLQDLTVIGMMEDDPESREAFAQMREALCGGDRSEAALLRVEMYLCSLVAPAKMTSFPGLTDATVRQTIIDAGTRLLQW